MTCWPEPTEPRSERPRRCFSDNGFTDDVFWADQVLVYYNLMRAQYPSAPVEVLFGDIGHQRAQSKPADLALMRTRIQAFFAHYVKGTGPQPPLGVTALTQTCPASAPSGGPYTAATWAELHPGVVNFNSQPTQTHPIHRRRSRGFQGVRPGLRRPLLYHRVRGR